MTGIEKITGRIAADAQAEADAILAGAQAQADEITARCQAQADKAAEELLARGRAAAADREERLVSSAEMQARQLALKARQETLDEAFSLALERLRALPEEEKTDLLARLAAKASATGREQVILDGADRDACGAQVVSRANALLGAQGALALSPAAGRFRGGLVLSDGEVEVNCTFETLVRLARSQMAGDVARVLFDETRS